MTDSRDSILQSIAKCRDAARPIPDYKLPELAADNSAHFIAKARASVAFVHEIGTTEDVPVLIWTTLSQAGLPPRLHIPANSSLNALPWHRAPGLSISIDPPSGDESACSQADFGVAETGTLVFISGPQSPSSWHFRPGREFVLVKRTSIVSRLEDIIARISAGGYMPATVNLITGPSRTADIEQTIELGAHGPRDMHVLIAN